MVRVALYFIVTILLVFILQTIMNFLMDLFKTEEEISEKDIDFVKKLIESDMLNFYIVSLISSDNVDTKESWEDNKKQLIKLQKCIEKMQIVDKKHIMRQINESIKIIDTELKKYA